MDQRCSDCKYTVSDQQNTYMFICLTQRTICADTEPLRVTLCLSGSFILKVLQEVVYYHSVQTDTDVTMSHSLLFYWLHDLSLSLSFLSFVLKIFYFVFYFEGLWVVTVNNSMMFKWVAVKQLWGSGGGSDPFTSHSFMKRKHRPDSGCVLSSALTSDLLFHSSSFLWSVKFSFQFIEMSEFIKNW